MCLKNKQLETNDIGLEIAAEASRGHGHCIVVALAVLRSFILVIMQLRLHLTKQLAFEQERTSLGCSGLLFKLRSHASVDI